jgi:DNA polymerase-3 subunit beta
MKNYIMIDATELKRAYIKLERVRAKRNTIPILGYCLFEARENTVLLSITNFDIDITVTLDCEGSGDGKFMLSMQMMKCAATMTDSVTIGYDCDKINISDGTCDMVINNIMAHEDFPKIHIAKGVGSKPLVMGQPDLHRLLHLSRHCICKDATRYYIDGVHMHSKPNGDTLRVEAIDGDRLAVIDSEINAQKGLDVIIPTSLVKVIYAGINAKGNDAVSFIFWDNKLTFNLGNTKITAKVIDGKFPDITRVIPEKFGNIEVHINAETLKRIAAFQYDSRMAVIDPDKKTVSLKNKVNEITMPCQIKTKEGYEPRKVGFNIKYLLDQAKITPTFRLRQQHAFDPAMIDTEDANAFWLSMPMRV